MNPEVAVLVSAGRHPASGRPRRAPGDARALELALRLTDRPRVLFAGNPEEPALRDYLGMGVPEVTVLECPDGANPIPCLTTELARLQPGLILTGMRSEHGPATGYLPYAVAHALDAALAPAILGITPGHTGLHLAQALPAGRRRSLWTPGPVVALVDPAAPAPRLPAYGPARRGAIRPQAPAVPLPEEPEPEVHPARKRPKRLRVAGGSAAERQAAIRGAAGGSGQVLTEASPAEAARAIHRYLLDEGILRPARPAGEAAESREESASG